MIVMHGICRLFERAPFNLDQEIRKFAFSGQFANPNNAMKLKLLCI
jgi:hypothetical protein